MENKLKEQLDTKIEELVGDELSLNNLDILNKLVNMQTDLANQEYWEKKKEVMDMNYRNYNDGYSESYGNYGRRGVPGSGRGHGRRYSRRGVDTKYAGQEVMDDMYEAYGEYSEGRERYGHHPSTMKSLDYMLKSVVEFIEMLKEDASSLEEVQLIQKYTREISEM